MDFGYHLYNSYLQYREVAKILNGDKSASKRAYGEFLLIKRRLCKRKRKK